MSSVSGSASVATTVTATENVVNAQKDATIDLVNNAATIVQNTSDFLEYPHDFFHKSTGANPKSNAEAAKLWPFRKNRPAKGLVDQVPADGAVIIR